MQPGKTAPLDSVLGQIEILAAGISEGVMVLDGEQGIVWANAIALAIHDETDLAALGQNIDEYHANFQVRYRSIRKPAAPANSSDVIVKDRLRDSLIEITTANGNGEPSLHRTRKLSVPDERGQPLYTLLFITPVPAGAEGPGRIVSALKDAAGAAAILRCRDSKLVESNAEFRRLINSGEAGCVSDATDELIAQADCAAQLRHCIVNGVSFPLALTSIPDDAGGRKPALIAGQRAEYDGEACIVLNLVEWDALRPVVAPVVRKDSSSMRGFVAGLCAAAPGLAHVLDADMRVVAASKSWLDWIGVDMPAAVGRKVTEFMTDACATHFVGTVWGVLASGGVVKDQTCQFVTGHGRTIDAVISATATQDEDGGVLWAVLLTVDGAETQRAEDRFAKLMALSPTPLLVHRMEDNRILDVNDAFTALTGYQAGAVIGHVAGEFWHCLAKPQRGVIEQDLRAGRRVQKIGVKLKTEAGDTMDALLSAEMVQAFGQDCALLAFEDVTDRRRSEAELFEAIETVMEDTTWFTQSVIEKMASLRRPSRAGTPAPEIGDLTPREREVLGFISHGMTDADIAKRLGLTRCTVRNHVATLYGKIGVHSRSSAIVWARERGVNLSWPLEGPAHLMRAAAPARRPAGPPKSRERA